MSAPKLNRQLALFHFLLSKFGFRDFNELQHEYRDKEFDSSTSENSIFYINLSSKVSFPAGILKQYDSNLIAHLQKINELKLIPIRLKYYQYFSLLFTEYYLDRYYTENTQLKEDLNAFILASAIPGIKSLEQFSDTDLNKLAYWNATGSGKTFILHINILQLQYYAQINGLKYRSLILLTPSEDLSAQHLADLRSSNIQSNYYWEDKESWSVKVIDIHKIREYSTGQGVTVPLAEFDRDNIIFVDEGHKGNKSEDSAWRYIRNTLSSNGFAFEYSATFGQLNDVELIKEYAKCISFDYSYGHFYEDGYGKDYWIHNLENKDLFAEGKQNQYLLQNLLLFIQQKVFFAKKHNELEPYSIEDPLLIFVGSSVEPKPSSKTQIEENSNVVSDVKTVLDFFNDYLQNRSKFIKWIKLLKGYSDESLFKNDYYSKLGFLFTEIGSAEKIYEISLKLVFNSNTGGELELYTLRNADGEIALKIRGADSYFALIYIGDTATFKAPIQAQYEFKKDVTNNSLFHSLSDRQSNPINILIGARKFIEGWNNYRVSSIGLINFGRSKGSQIIQLFGRGIRLKGRELSLKRSRYLPDAPKDISIAECLNIFGLRADYMRQFKEDLEKEGINTIKRTYSFDVSITHDLATLSLITLERDGSAPKFEITDVFRLINEPTIKVRIDISTKKFVAIAGQQNANFPALVKTIKISDSLLELVDWDWIYMQLLLFKKRIQSPRMPNILIPKNMLKQLLSEINYRIITDNDIVINSLSSIEKLNKLVLQILTNYMELYYKRQLRNYDGNNLTTEILTETNSNIANARWEFEIITTDLNGDEIQDIQRILTDLEHLADKSANYPEKFKGNQLLLNTWLDAHIYQPVFNDENQQNLSAGGTRLIESVRPTGLNFGEIRFVEGIKNFISSQGQHYSDYDFYLLRNMSRGSGFGFYFLSGGFYPDFMLWIKNNTTNKQYLTFIDPHGLRNEISRWASEKINLHITIKSLEAQLGNQDLVLNSFILHPPPDDLFVAGLNEWHREDDPLREIPLNAYAGNHNVFAIPLDGNISGAGGVIDQIIQKILQS